MVRKIMPGILMLLVVAVVSGCSSTQNSGGGLTTRAYVVDKERVDQDMAGGNQGYLMGTPKERGDYKQTRKVFVMEFTKEVPEEDGSLVPPPRLARENRVVGARFLRRSAGLQARSVALLDLFPLRLARI